MTLGHFSPKKRPLYESYWGFFCVIGMWNLALTRKPAHCSTVNLITYLLISYVDVRFDTLIQWEFLLISLKFQNNSKLALDNNNNKNLLPSLFYLKTSFFHHFISPIRSMRCLPSSYLFLFFSFCNEPIDWAITQKVKLLGLPRIEGSILKHLWPSYICETRITFAKEYGIKVRCYWNPLGNMSKTWELLALNTPPPPPPTKKKTLHEKWTLDSPLSTPITTWNPTRTPHPQEKRGKEAHSLHDTTSHWLHVNPIPKIGCTIFGLDNCSVGSVSTLTKTNKFFFFFPKNEFVF